MKLEGKRVAVTGAFGSLGSVVVAALADAGAKVAAIDRAKAPASTKATKAFGDVDLGDEKSAQRAIGEAVRALGGLDALVNIAGGFRWETVADGSPDTWDLLYAMNLRTALCASKAAIAPLVESGAGRIVNIGAQGATKAGAGMGAYAASKAGIAKLTEALAEELKDRNVTVNALLPSIIDTPANRKDMPKAEFDRWVKPEELADAIAFLVSDHSRAITGALIPIVGRV